MRNRKITNDKEILKKKKKNLKTGKQNERQKNKYATYVFTINIDNCCIFFLCIVIVQLNDKIRILIKFIQFK